MSIKEKVYNYLKENKTMTGLDAVKHLNTLSYREAIRDLIKDGITIYSRYKENKHYKEYSLEKFEEEI